MDLDKEHKDKVLEKLLKVTVRNLERGNMNVNELRSLSSHILHSFKDIKNRAQLIDYLTMLSNKWPFYSEVLTVETGKEKEEEEKEKIKKVSKLIKEKKIDQAIEITKEL